MNKKFQGLTKHQKLLWVKNFKGWRCGTNKTCTLANPAKAVAVGGGGSEEDAGVRGRTMNTFILCAYTV